MNHTCEFATGTEADPSGFPIIIYCEAPAVNFKDKWLCPEHYEQATKSKGGYIYRQGVAATTTSLFSHKYGLRLDDDGWGDPIVQGLPPE